MENLSEMGPVPGTGALFVAKDCALIAIATGKQALTLGELLGFLGDIGPDSLYHHMWGGLLEPRFEEREYHNDFAAWARHGLHDGVLAERLGALDPTACGDLEELRMELVDIVEQRLYESEYLHWARATSPFELLRSQIVVFATPFRIEHPRQLPQLLPRLSAGSIFYHFIDARRRTPLREDDFSAYLREFGEEYEDLRVSLGDVDPYFSSLAEVRDQLALTFARRLGRAE